MWRTFSSTFWRNYLTMRRAYPWSFFIGHILSGIYTVLFAYLTYIYVFAGQMDSRFAGFSGTGDYISYVVLGGTVYSLAVSMLMIVSRSLITELREGSLEALLLTPCSRKGYFLGTGLQGLMRVGIEFSVIILIGWIFGLNLRKMDGIASFVVLTLTICSFFTQALVLGSVMLYFRDTYISQNTLFVVMSLVSGVMFPVQYLPAWLHPVSWIMPLNYGLQAFRRSVIEGSGLWASRNDLAALIVLSLVYLVIGAWAIQATEKIVVEKIFD